ncbi:MAG: FAD/NAD(P)-binding protein [Undibacterium sp.]|nr:FAD/NAD(P)-binding protein [Opitutaceae bacterium]
MIVPRLRHIAIIGGGFSGTMTAVNLARLSESPLRITLINHCYPSGRGIAYGTRRPEHLLNVAARNMSAMPDHPNHFVEWLRTRTEFAALSDTELRETFMPRRVYGDYLRSLAHHYARPVDRHARVQIEFRDDEVADIKPEADGARLILASGHNLDADKVILATGNEPPADLPGNDTVANHPGWCANPWLDWESKLPPAGETIVLLGTGLTTVDAIITLLALDWRGTLHAVSRHGLLPQSHFKGTEDPLFPPADVDLASLGLEALADLVETHCERLRAQGANPAMIVDKLRPHTQRIWQTFTDAERREFITRYAARWNVIRHRIAPSIHRQVMTAVDEGRLQISRASIAGVKPLGAKIGIDLRARDGTTSTLEAALAINCTGPHTRFSATRSQLLQNLLASGLAQPDSMNMGVRVESDFTVVERGGHRSSFLLAIGPLLRGTLWESIAVPELRGQSLRVAQTLLDELPAAAARWTDPAEKAVMEYWI